MRKMPTIFIRDENFKATREINPECQWVFDGFGKATRKWDGECCMVDNGKLYRRYTVKKGKPKPDDFYTAGQIDPFTGNEQGWRPVDLDAPENQWYKEAFIPTCNDGAYELIGPKVRANAENKSSHLMIQHGSILTPIEEPPRDFDALYAYLSANDIEGIVFHHTDGRMAKIKCSDFNIKRKSKSVIVEQER